jgi:hypothetical protein
MAAGTMNIFAQNEIVGKVKFVGGNDIGPQITMELNKVMFRPDAAIGLISDEWGQLTLQGEVLVDDTGIFGTITHPDSAMTSPLVDAYISTGVVSIRLTLPMSTSATSRRLIYASNAALPLLLALR